MIVKVNKNNQTWLAKESGIVFFLSLDIVGSTQYKLHYPINWMLHYSHFFEKVLQYFIKDNVVSNSMIFKENGDEAIIVFSPIKQEDLQNILDTAVLITSSNTPFREVLKKNGLDYKATLFCGGYSEPEPFTVYTDNEERLDLDRYNYFFKCDYKNHRMHRTISAPRGNYTGQPSSWIIGSIKECDFIGPDIDIGFRISKYAKSNILTVSDKVAYIFTTLFPDEYSFKIYKKVRLKGVWYNKKYPIIQYDHNDRKKLKFKKIYKHVRNIVFPEKFLKKLKKDLNISI